RPHRDERRVGAGDLIDPRPRLRQAEQHEQDDAAPAVVAERLDYSWADAEGEVGREDAPPRRLDLGPEAPERFRGGGRPDEVDDVPATLLGEPVGEARHPRVGEAAAHPPEEVALGVP